MGGWSIGMDIIEVRRFRQHPQSKYPHFYARVFNEAEQEYCLRYGDPYPHFSGIFAAKEAVFKAINKVVPVKLSQITIEHDNKGEPAAKIDTPMTVIDPKNLEIKISISHTNTLALAWAFVLYKSLSSELAEQ
nr:4'-phosphopantetheinyl transferase superfamily protein [Candidatus Njordarchaeota archaeon]